MCLQPVNWGWVVILLPWCRNILSILLDTGRGIVTETGMLHSVFPPNHHWFGSDIKDDLCYM